MWFERKFQFDALSTTFPIVVERLSGTPLRLRRKLDNLDHRLLTTKIGDRWSVLENAGHLLDLEPLWLGRVHDMIEGKEMLREADLTNRLTTEAGHNHRPASELALDFEVARSRLIDVLTGLEDRSETLQSKHPRLGTPMRLIDLAYFVAEHDDHHLVTINRIAREIS